jgi:hypothetical protein
MRIILAGIASGIAMFIWSFCSHTVLSRVTGTQRVTGTLRRVTGTLRIIYGLERAAEETGD